MLHDAGPCQKERVLQAFAAQGRHRFSAERAVGSPFQMPEWYVSSQSDFWRSTKMTTLYTSLDYALDSPL